MVLVVDLKLANIQFKILTKYVMRLVYDIFVILNAVKYLKVRLL